MHAAVRRRRWPGCRIFQLRGPRKALKSGRGRIRLGGRMIISDKALEVWMRKTIELAVVIMVLASAVMTAGAESRITKGATVEGITEYQLDNGLRVLLYPDPS